MADCDLRAGLHAKRWFDAVGHYSREDVLRSVVPAGGRPRRRGRRRRLTAGPPGHHQQQGDGDRHGRRLDVDHLQEPDPERRGEHPQHERAARAARARAGGQHRAEQRGQEDVPVAHQHRPEGHVLERRQARRRRRVVQGVRGRADLLADHQDRVHDRGDHDPELDRERRRCGRGEPGERQRRTARSAPPGRSRRRATTR